MIHTGKGGDTGLLISGKLHRIGYAGWKEKRILAVVILLFTPCRVINPQNSFVDRLIDDPDAPSKLFKFRIQMVKGWMPLVYQKGFDIREKIREQPVGYSLAVKFLHHGS
jgi:hypothetical protein